MRDPRAVATGDRVRRNGDRDRICRGGNVEVRIRPRGRVGDADDRYGHLITRIDRIPEWDNDRAGTESHATCGELPGRPQVGRTTVIHEVWAGQLWASGHAQYVAEKRTCQGT